MFKNKKINFVVGKIRHKKYIPIKEFSKEHKALAYFNTIGSYVETDRFYIKNLNTKEITTKDNFNIDDFIKNIPW